MQSVNDLNKLEPFAFEHLVNALAIKVLGAGATGFGPGGDGGRDGWFEGKAPYPSTNACWDGVWYIQCKFHAPHLSKDPQKWLLEQIRKELSAYNASGGHRRWPDNWIIATNINPSGVAEKGLFDQACKLVSKARPALGKRFHIWGGDKICNFLNDYPNIAARFGHFLTPGHVISTLLENVGDDRASAEEIIKLNVNQGIEDQRHTRLEQAGARDDQRPSIDELFVDLPFIDAHCKVKAKAVASLASASALNHRLNLEDDLDERWDIWRTHPNRASIWFVRAGPGRGKSSISQFFCQVQRAALILQPGGLPVRSDIRSLAKRIKRCAEEVGAWPISPRIPLWVELKSYAAWFGQQSDQQPRGVATYICAMMRKGLEVNVPVGVLRKALSVRSWVVIFDGLDEVPSDVKDLIANEVIKFVRNTHENADLFVVCTSRPQGYSGQFDALGGATIDLVDLPADLALECATKLTAIHRSTADAERAQNILKRSLESPAVRELMTTPLQAHIMAVLVRNGQQPPERKWDLYKQFYEVIRVRETNRNLPDQRLRELFQRYPMLIDSVHHRLGFALHSRAERASGADASLSNVEFRRIVEGVVREAQEHPDVESIVDTLMRATTERLVLINTPDQGDRVRFDLRAIQEFFAAEFMYIGVPAEIVRERLERISGDAHWREVVQFVLGALISTQRATEWAVALEVLRAVNDGDDDERALAWRLARGALHCALVLYNGVAEHNKKTREQIRSLLLPMASATDKSLTDVLCRVTPPDSRLWIRRWATEQVRSLQVLESRGAFRILVALSCDSEEMVSEVIGLLDDLRTPDLADLLDNARQYGRRDIDESRYPRWIAEAQDRLLRRDDCISLTPAVVSRVLWQANIHNRAVGDIHLSRRNIQKTAGYIADQIQQLYGEMKEDRVGDIVIRKLHLRPGADVSLKNNCEGGVLKWIALIARFKLERKMEDLGAALRMMGDSWGIFEVLPVELLDTLPLPVDPTVTPAALGQTLEALTSSSPQTRNPRFRLVLSRSRILGYSKGEWPGASIVGV